jgi:hypothetical protein
MFVISTAADRGLCASSGGRSGPSTDARLGSGECRGGNVVDPVKDPEVEAAVPEAWRPVLGAIVDSLVRRDLVLGADLTAVDPASAVVRQQCLQAVEDYGDATLIPLPDEAWSTSVTRWLGDRWSCLVDLWTEQDGRSDLVLDVYVFEQGPGYRFCIRMVYVP